MVQLIKFYLSIALFDAQFNYTNLAASDFQYITVKPIEKHSHVHNVYYLSKNKADFCS